MIPLWLMIRVEEKGKHGLAIPVPIILVWLLLAALLLLLLPLVLLAALLSWPWGWGKPLLQIYFHIFVLIGSLSGLKLDISSREHDKTTHVILR
ncbi:MAG: hypothetical protein NTZ12_00470 [Candidatus Aminicenantes bacterium]|nr:hypothetical protein [Candidatus Aminicenantes bacterium]